MEGFFERVGIFGKDIGDLVYPLLTLLVLYLTNNPIKQTRLRFHDSALISLSMSTVNDP